MNTTVNAHIQQIKDILESKGWQTNRTKLSLKKGENSINFDKLESHFDINLFNSLDTSDDNFIGSIFCFDSQTKLPRPPESIAQMVESSF